MKIGEGQAKKAKHNAIPLIKPILKEEKVAADKAGQAAEGES